MKRRGPRRLARLRRGCAKRKHGATPEACPPNDDTLRGVLAFIRQAENLKNTLRQSHTSTGRHESAAEHSWRLCLLILACSGLLAGLCVEKSLKLAIVHDLGEAISGDTPAISLPQAEAKSARERRDMRLLCAPLPENLREEFLSLWEEYEAASTAEAKMVKGLDKLETLAQHNQGCNPPNFDYTFNLSYGRSHTDSHPLLQALRNIIDEETFKHVTLGT